MIRSYDIVKLNTNITTSTIITTTRPRQRQQQRQQHLLPKLLFLLFSLLLVLQQQQVDCFTIIKIKQQLHLLQQSHYLYRRFYSTTTASRRKTITRQRTNNIYQIGYTTIAGRCKSYTYIPYNHYNGRKQQQLLTSTSKVTSTFTMMKNDINIVNQEEDSIMSMKYSNNDDTIVKEDYYFANTIEVPVVERNVEETAVEVQVPVSMATSPILSINNQQNDTNTINTNQSKEEQQEQQEEEYSKEQQQKQIENEYNKKKYHHYTICVVPPAIESNQYIWDTIQYTRQLLKDPGYYRWPPHINLLYPFHNPYTTTTNTSTTGSTSTSINTTKSSNTTSTISSQENTGTTTANDFVTNDKSNIMQDEQSTNGTNTFNTNKKKNKNSISETTAEINLELVQKLINACSQCEPFICHLNNFGTFGNSNRGVLWLNPQTTTTTTPASITGNTTTFTSNTSITNSITTETDTNTNTNTNTNTDIDTDIDTDTIKIRSISQLHKLQSLLEEQFPICTDLRLKGTNGIFVPHMTICHFHNINDTNDAIQQLYNERLPLSLVSSKSKTSTVSVSEATVSESASTVAESASTSTSTVAESESASSALVGSEITNLQFTINEIYLLQRNGDNGQFYRVADIRLGKNNVITSSAGIVTTATSTSNEIAYYGIDNNDTCSTASVVVYPTPIPFQYMPTVEDQWVNDERMKLKSRRNNNNNNRRRRRSLSNPPQKQND